MNANSAKVVLAGIILFFLANTVGAVTMIGFQSCGIWVQERKNKDILAVKFLHKPTFMRRALIEITIAGVLNT